MNWRLSECPGAPQRLLQPMVKCKHMRKQQSSTTLSYLCDCANPRGHACSPITGKPCEDHEYSYEWARGQKPHLTQNGRQIQCNTKNYVPIVLPGLRTGSSSSCASTSPTSLPQDTSEDSSSCPATTRRDSTSIPVLGNELRDPTETQKTQLKIGTSYWHRETCCAIFQNGCTISQKIHWTKECQHQFGTSCIELGTSYPQPVARFAGMVGRFRRKFIKRKECQHQGYTRKHLFGTSCKSGIEEA